MLTRAQFTQQRATAKRIERRAGLVLALWSVILGLLQLLFLRWADAHLARGPRLAIAGSAFLVYSLVVAGLLWRLERRVRAVRPRCPQCGAPLKGLTERLASVTGRCDICGGRILQEEVPRTGDAP